MTINIYTTKETAALLKISTRTLFRYMKEGKIEAFRVGNTWRFTEQAINEFITSAADNSKKEAV